MIYKGIKLPVKDLNSSQWSPMNPQQTHMVKLCKSMDKVMKLKALLWAPSLWHGKSLQLDIWSVWAERSRSGGHDRDPSGQVEKLQTSSGNSGVTPFTQPRVCWWRIWLHCQHGPASLLSSLTCKHWHYLSMINNWGLRMRRSFC